MRVVFLLLGVAAVVAKNSTSSTGSDPAMSSTGAANMSSTGAAPMSSTGAANMSSTGAVPMANMSSTGADPMANMSSTGAASMSSTGASASTGMAPGQCSTLDSCGSCFSSGCVWCFTNEANEFPCRNASTTCNDPKIPLDLPTTPLNFIDLTKFGSDACEFVDCISALNANVNKLGEMQLALLSDGAYLESKCVNDFEACNNDPTSTYCNLNCSFPGADDETYKQSCNNLTMSSGSVCEYSFDNNYEHIKANFSKDIVYAGQLLCVPDTCVSQSNWSQVFADAQAASLAATKECKSVSSVDPVECKVKSVELGKCVAAAGSSSTGLSTGALVAIVLGSLVGVLLLFFCGQKMCTSQKSEYQAIANN